MGVLSDLSPMKESWSRCLNEDLRSAPSLLDQQGAPLDHEALEETVEQVDRPSVLEGTGRVWFQTQVCPEERVRTETAQL